MKNNLLSEKLVYTGDTRTPTHLHLVRYTPDEVHEYTADSLPPIEPQFSEKGMIWLQVHGLKETETVRQVCDRFGIDFLVMQDILNADHPTKVEEHERYMLVVAKFFRGGEEMQVCLVQGADFVLSFIESESPLFDDIPQAIRNNVLKFRSRPSDYLLSVLLNSITANYATLISKLDGDLDDLETGLLSTTDCRDTGGQIQELRHRYLQLKQAALPLRDQYAKLLHSDSALLQRRERPPAIRRTADRPLPRNALVARRSLHLEQRPAHERHHETADDRLDDLHPAHLPRGRMGHELPPDARTGMGIRLSGGLGGDAAHRRGRLPHFPQEGVALRPPVVSGLSPERNCGLQIA